MRRLMAALAVCFALPVQAAQDGVTEFKLENGLQVVVIEDHRAPVVVQMLWYRAGAADEKPGVSGVAHFLEHLLFKATDTMEAGELSRVVTENGGSDNAFTSQDYTAYFQRIAADRLPLIMRMEADRMRNLRLTEEDVATEREVILEERAQRTDSDPGSLFYEQMRAAQYLNHPYGIPVIGWRHEMENLSRTAALEYYQRFYAPNNATLVVAGDVNPEEVRQLAETYYGPLEPTADLAPRARITEPPQLAERRLRMADARVSQPYLMRSYLAPERDPGNQKEAAALVYLSEILGGSGATSVLGRALQFDNQIAVYAGASYGATALDDTSFSLVVVPNGETSLRAAETALDDTLETFLAGEIDVAQFERIKFQLKASEIYAQDNAQARADRYGRALSAGLTLQDIDAWQDVLQAVTPDDVMAVARKVLNRKQSVTGWLVPEGGEEM
ncbi:putative zinc protease [Aliiroseovarius sp. xm-m-379]|uniref:M16 family metallopeptidase n=1 Tax=unclassified Aliiroseovarius TaxID=2623558 RepID=UPI001569E91F|nr:MULTISPECIES: pitrilysin family protein [unclassified Aliiroseovarius]NRP13683.1 putative zinc protease [Aliiroseovarius sp. xm-d-517]NRP24945.1 putative zinc protease [Aliiroseovarius sp. xm-m-379]NRP31534.1 putative zinc protease [Aliiroseovarius sp. xm-m-314]NRP33744.1 putative zinc protease [Aliiroseovarius sp. xm-a-104]NRP41177.1 putative zinc protease [Aliiroseovarius sp. xm-m-339-2]